MVFQRIISRFPCRAKISGQTQRLYAPNYNPFVKFSDQSPKPISQIAVKRDMFSGTLVNFGGPTRVLHNTVPRFLGNLGIKFGFAQTSSIHSSGQKEFENGPIGGSDRRSDDINTRQSQTQPQPHFNFESLTRRLTDMDRTRPPNTTGWAGRPFESGRNTNSMNFIRGILKDNLNDQNYRSGFEQNADIVHIKIMRNNTFVTVTDSKGNKKMGASAGSLAEMKGGPKVSKYSAEATAEHVGRLAKSMGLKSVVMKVNGFTFFKRKKLAILSFRDGYTHSRSDKNPIVYIEDTTRKPHNGCRLRKQRRV